VPHSNTVPVSNTGDTGRSDGFMLLGRWVAAPSLADRRAACLVYALEPATDTELQGLVALIAADQGASEGATFLALDDLMTALAAAEVAS
jgi:hypothetical protein